MKITAITNKLSLIALLLPGLTLGAISDKQLELHYNPDYGTYSLPIRLGDNATPINFIVDTGSSNLMVIGNPKTCQNCKPYISTQVFKPNSGVKSQHRTADIHYGFGGGRFWQYQGPVTLANNMQVANMTFGVYKEGINISNILGMAYQRIASPKHAAPPTLFDEVNQKYQLNNSFALQLCAGQGPSLLTLGKVALTAKQEQQRITIPVISKTFYTVMLSSISNAQGKTIVDLKQHQRNIAIMDSATTAKIVLFDGGAKQLNQYLRQHTSARNQALPQEFWNGSSCLSAEDFDSQAFPDLSFNFAGNHGKTISVTLSAKDYITRSGCGKGDFYKLAFVDQRSHQADSKTLAHKKQPQQLSMGALLGTPFLENFITVFDKENPAQIRLYPKAGICK